MGVENEDGRDKGVGVQRVVGWEIEGLGKEGVRWAAGVRHSSGCDSQAPRSANDDYNLPASVNTCSAIR